MTTASTMHDLNRTGPYSIMQQRFAERALTAGGVGAVHGWTESTVDPIVDGYFDGWSVARVRTSGFRVWLATKDEATLYFMVESDGSWALWGAAGDQQTTDGLIEGLRSLLPEPTAAEDDGSVWVRFWAMGGLGPMSYYRRLSAAPWSEASDNYPSSVRDGQVTSTREALDSLMTMGPPTTGGRLVLMHGPPGTGKTHAIRALAQSLRPWCSVDYVIDVDAFFEIASYMVQTMVMEDAPSLDAGEGDVPVEPWRLVVLEDSGEYLRGDASDKVGLGLGRLLNLADGLVGQGLRLILLMTTNEPVEELHPAVTRDGRCMANICMGPFSAEEGERWLAAHGIDATLDADTPVTLAQLYTKLNAVIGEAVPVTASGRSRLRWTARRTA